MFSSGLIKTSDESHQGNSFHVSKDIWIFTLSSLVVSICTLLITFWWAKRTPTKRSGVQIPATA
jgi:hypothetical protein